MRASASRERGFSRHLESSGYLLCIYGGYEGRQTLISNTHETNPLAIRGSIMISRPEPSNGREILNVCSTLATLMKMDASPKCLPGHVLIPMRSVFTVGVCSIQITHLLPNPNTKSAGSRTSGSSFPSRRKRSGLNSCGLSYASRSCRQALSYEALLPPSPHACTNNE